MFLIWKMSDPKLAKLIGAWQPVNHILTKYEPQLVNTPTRGAKCLWRMCERFRPNLDNVYILKSFVVHLIKLAC